MRRNKGLGAADACVGVEECAATQTWQLADSSDPECRCQANANADHKVSASATPATSRVIGRINLIIANQCANPKAGIRPAELPM